MTSKPILNEAGQFYRTLSLREADSLTADQWAKYQNWIRDLINNPPHACESCGSQVEFPGLIYCARCQRSKSRRAAEVQAAAEPHKPMQNYLVQASHSAVFAKSDEQLLDEAYPIPDTPHTSVMERCNLQRAAMQRGLTAARSVPAAPRNAMVRAVGITLMENGKGNVTDARELESTTAPPMDSRAHHVRSNPPNSKKSPCNWRSRSSAASIPTWSIPTSAPSASSLLQWKPRWP